MSPLAHRAALAAALLIVAACTDRTSPVEPDQSRPDDPVPALSAVQARNERLARRLALALRDDDFRAMVARSLATSREREGKVHLQRLLDGNSGAVRRRLAVLSGEPESAIYGDLSESAALEIYLPVPEHRRRWDGDPNLLVATAERDRDRPVAFDLQGHRRLLDANRPPSIPVMALGRAESKFQKEAIPAFDGCMTCDTDPDGGGFTGGGPAGGGTGTGSGGGSSLVSQGLYMTYAKYTQTFEGSESRYRLRS